MKSVNSALFGLVLVALAGASTYAGAMPMSAADKATMKSCMAMSDDAMAKDAKCTAAMEKSMLTATDVQKIKACKAMSKDAMANDQDCVAMKKAHGDLMATKSK